MVATSLMLGSRERERERGREREREGERERERERESYKNGHFCNEKRALL